MLEEEQEANYLNPNNQDNNNLSLPTPEELIPLSQTLIPTNLALAFDILTDPSSKRPRLVWTPHLHRRFVDSVSQLGIKHAVPKAIMQLMGVEGLSRENVASHLQKYRQYLKRIGSGLGGGGGDPAMDRLFSSSPVPALFLQQFNSSRDNNNSNSNNLSPFSAVGAVGELVFRPEGFRGVGANGSVSNLVSEHSFLMGQSQQRSTSDKRDNLSPFTAVGVVGELGSGTKGFRGVVANGSGSDRPSDHSFLMAQMQSGGDRRDDLSPFSAVGLRENGPVSNLVSEHSFFVGQSRQSSSTNRENVSPFSTLGPVQELGFRPEGSRRVAVNGSVSNLVFEHSFLMGQSQQSSCGNKEKMSPFSAVGTVRELGFGTEGFQGVGENGLVSNLGSERSFFMGQSQQSSTNRENLLPFSAVQPEIGFRPEGFRRMGAIGPGSYRLCDGSLQMGRSQMYGSSPMYVDEMATGDSVGGRRVLALFPTREDD